jgi:hypothetical protein
LAKALETLNRASIIEGSDCVWIPTRFVGGLWRTPTAGMLRKKVHCPLMADGPLSPIRPEVRQYLKACEDLIAGTEGAQEQFRDASRALQLKTGVYTDEELTLVQHMLHRVSETLANDPYR